MVHIHSIFYALVVKKLPLPLSGLEKHLISIVDIDQHLLFFLSLLTYNNLQQMFDYFANVATVLAITFARTFSGTETPEVIG